MVAVTKNRLLLLSVAALSFVGSVVGSEDSGAGESEVVQADVRRIAAAVYSSDVDTAIAFTHPQILELMGGEARARELLEGAFAQIESLEMKLESLVFQQAPTFVSGTSNDYVVVPTESVISAKGQRFRSENFQFGIRPKSGTKWTYIEGSRVSGEILESLFPDFPSDFVFPPVSRERM